MGGTGAVRVTSLPHAPIQPPSQQGPRRRPAWQRRERLAPYLFLGPAIGLFVTFLLWPLVRSLWLSFYTTAGPRSRRMVGLGNYHFLLFHDPLFWLAIINTTAYTLCFVALLLPISLALALALNHPHIRGRSLLRLSFFSSYLVGPVFVATLFFSLLSPRDGLINRMLSLLSPRFIQIDWLTDPIWVLPALLMAGLWLACGQGMIYCLAALQAIEPQLYEAAEMDGANAWQRFWHITLQQTLPVLRFLALIGTVAGFQLFELPYVLFQGPGPDLRALSIVMYLYSAGFDRGDLGYASAVGWLLVLILLVVIGTVRGIRALAERV